MRNQHIIPLVVLTTLALIGCTGPSPQTAVPQDAEVRVYEVFGMDCPGCHGAVEKLVEKLEPVADAEADWQAQRLTVTLRPGQKLDDEAVHDTIGRANFTAGERLE